MAAQRKYLTTREANTPAKFLAGDFVRSATVEKINKEDRTIELSFSSDVELERWPGVAEKLSHTLGAVDLSRLNDKGALLFNHDFDQQIGVIENARIDSDGKGRAKVRFGKSTLAEEKWRDVQDGILTKTSVGYRIKEVKLTSESEELDVYTVTRWQPYEISMVSVPADTSVGVGRDIAQPNETLQNIMNREQIITLLKQRGFTIADNATDEQLRKLLDEALSNRSAPAASPTPPASSVVDVVNERRGAAQSERERVNAILEAARKFDGGSHVELGEQFVRDGKSPDEFRAALLEKIEKRNEGLRQAGAPLGLSEKETRRYSFVKAIRALANPGDRAAQKDAGFEIEVSEAAAAKRGQAAKGLIIPTDVLTTPLDPEAAKRADVISIKTGAGYTGTGGSTVATTLLVSSFVDILRNRTVLMNLGTHLGGLVGDVDIPKKTSGATGYWIGEDDDAGQTDIDFGSFSMSPKTVAAYADITRKMLKQSSLGIEALVRGDIIAGMAETIDTAGWYGDGLNNKPLGLINQPGIETVNFAAAQPTFAELVEMETRIANNNADVASMAYVSNPAFRGYAKTTLKFANVAGTIWEPGNTVNGYRTEITNQITAAEIFFANYADYLIAMWGGLDLTVDTSVLSKKGGVRVIAFQDVDMNIRRAKSFCYGKKAA